MWAKSFLLWLSGPKLQSKISFEPLVKYDYDIEISGETCMLLESRQSYFSSISWEQTGRQNNIDNLTACNFFDLLTSRQAKNILNMLKMAR